jgi:L-rhamnose mutarotase
VRADRNNQLTYWGKIIMRLRITVALAAAAVSFCSLTQAAGETDERAYTEGSVVNVSFIRTEPGKFNEYMKYLQTTYKSLMEEEKKAGLIVNYSIFAARPRRPDDADLILTIEFKNMAALDNLQTKTEPLQRKVWATLSKADEASAARGKLRTELGSELLRELKLK